MVLPCRSAVEKLYHDLSATMAKEHGLVIHIVLFTLSMPTARPVSGSASGREAWQQPCPEHDPLDVTCRFSMSDELQDTRKSTSPALFKLLNLYAVATVPMPTPMRTLRASDTRNGPSMPFANRLVNVAVEVPAVKFLLQADTTVPYTRASLSATDMSTSSTSDSEKCWSGLVFVGNSNE